MSLLANRRSNIILFSDPCSPDSQRVRIVLAEKGATAEVIDVDIQQPPEDLLDLNPYCSLPTLVDRDLVLYDSRLILEYLDERFPHPPMLSADPVNRARARLLAYRIEKDWYEIALALEKAANKSEQEALRKQLRERLLASVPLFANAKPFLMGEGVSMADCTAIPILWRLKHYAVDLPSAAMPIHQYMHHAFELPAVKASLSGAEVDMRL